MAATGTGADRPPNRDVGEALAGAVEAAAGLVGDSSAETSEKTSADATADP